MDKHGFFRRILNLGEKQALLELLPYIDYSVEASGHILSMLDISGEKHEDLTSRIRELERMGDELTLSITTEITQGAINVTLLGHLLSLVETFDDLLDRSLYISREIKRFHGVAHKFSDDERNVIDFCYSNYRKMLENHLLSLSLLSRILKSNRLDSMRSIKSEIENLEERVDEIKDDILDYLYSSAERIGYLSFNHLSGLVHKIDDLLDDCEDVSDLIITVVSSINK